MALNHCAAAPGTVRFSALGFLPFVGLKHGPCAAAAAGAHLTAHEGGGSPRPRRRLLNEPHPFYAQRAVSRVDQAARGRSWVAPCCPPPSQWGAQSMVGEWEGGVDSCARWGDVSLLYIDSLVRQWTLGKESKVSAFENKKSTWRVGEGPNQR